jgi:hypothetical protein
MPHAAIASAKQLSTSGDWDTPIPYTGMGAMVREREWEQWYSDEARPGPVRIQDERSTERRGTIRDSSKLLVAGRHCRRRTRPLRAICLDLGENVDCLVAAAHQKLCDSPPPARETVSRTRCVGPISSIARTAGCRRKRPPRNGTSASVRAPSGSPAVRNTSAGKGGQKARQTHRLGINRGLSRQK